MISKYKTILFLLVLASCSSCTDPVSECDDGGKQCTPTGVPQVCVSGSWVDQAACSGNLSCVEGACIEVCNNNSQRCTSDGKIQVCSDGKWSEGIQCANGLQCVNGNCVKLSP